MKEHLSAKQILIIKIIDAGSDPKDPAAGPIDLDQLLERLPYITTKESMQFSIRALIGRVMIIKLPTVLRRGRQRACYGLTASASALLRGSPDPAHVIGLGALTAASQARLTAQPSLEETASPKSLGLPEQLPSPGAVLFSAGNSLQDLLDSLPEAVPHRDF